MATYEIEKKYLITTIPFPLESYTYRIIEQGYLSTVPVVRVRQDNNDYYLTYKGHGMMMREEYNLPLTKDSYDNLIRKVDGIVIRKKRYEIPLENTSYTIELDIFQGAYDGLKMAEVEFPSAEAANSFIPPTWFGEDVTLNLNYHNSILSQQKKDV